jgi:hypothetical protein
MDERFCSLCRPGQRSSRQPPRHASDASLDEILAFLNEQEIRATYGAVAEVLGTIPLAMGALLGTRRPKASWVVAADTGLPTAYEPTDCHPSLFRHSDIIRTAHELRLRLSVWLAKRSVK